MTKTINLITAITLALSTGIYSLAFAAGEKQSLSDFFEQEVYSLDQAVQEVPSDVALVTGETKDDGYFFRRFWLRLRPRVERDIPGLASFAIIPEVQLLWEKQTPEGWELYKIEKKKK